MKIFILIVLICLAYLGVKAQRPADKNNCNDGKIKTAHGNLTHDEYNHRVRQQEIKQERLYNSSVEPRFRYHIHTKRNSHYTPTKTYTGITPNRRLLSPLPKRIN